MHWPDVDEDISVASLIAGRPSAESAASLQQWLDRRQEHKTGKPWRKIAEQDRPADEAHRTIHVRGAREHNLKNVDLEIPRDALIVFTGLSGSGKSSLAFDTIYAEGQRRYVESLSAYARQFLEMMQKPDVDHIDGLSPAISIEQKTTSKNPRSTVGTVTEIYDYLRLLFARVGVPYSPATGLPIESQTVHADGGPRAGAAGGHAPLPAGADRARAQGRVPQGAGRAAEEGLPARQDQRHVLRDRRGAQARQEIQARHRRGGGPHRRAKQATSRDARWPTASRRRWSWPTASPSPSSPTSRSRLRPLPPSAGRGSGRGAATSVERKRLPLTLTPPRKGTGRGSSTEQGRPAQQERDARAHHLLGALRLPGVRLHHRRDRAAAVLVQRAGRRLPEVRRARHRDAVRGRPGGARPHAQPEAGRRLSLGQDRQHLALLRADAGGAGQALQGVDDDAVGEAAQEGAGRHPLRHRRGGGRRSSTRTACAATRTPSRSRA